MTRMKELQADRTDLLKPQAFLPRDPYLMALMDMQKNGAFVGNILSGWRSENWAPELKGLLSMESAQGTRDLKKRKRDSGVADMGSEQGASKSPRLDLDDEAIGQARHSSAAAEGTMLDIPADEGLPQDDFFGDMQGGSPPPGFDETTAPIVHPADSGPVSLATKHAVHVLRELFGSEAATNEDARKSSAVVFQDLLPEDTTSKADATKMFFECLVLATKDAIKVEQGEDLGAPIRIRGKRGLWGAWAEREAGGEIARQEEEEAEVATSSRLPATVSVEA